jgi:hypothetical protein
VDVGWPVMRTPGGAARVESPCGVGIRHVQPR